MQSNFNFEAVERAIVLSTNGETSWKRIAEILEREGYRDRRTGKPLGRRKIYHAVYYAEGFYPDAFRKGKTSENKTTRPSAWRA